MTMGPENLGAGPAAQDRFASQYGELASRTGGLSGELASRTGNLSGELASRAGSLSERGAYHGVRREGGPPAEPLTSDRDLSPSRNGNGPSLPSLDDDLTEPTFPPANWLDAAEGSLADHPLLRGLLLELPPKGSVPPPGWLDRWFEAARSILELLYLQEVPPRSR